MHKIPEYIVLFFLVVLLQAFLFSRIGVSVYLNPLVYVAFILLLPMEIGGLTLLMLGFVLGVSVDYLTGTAGIHTIASLVTAFSRPVILRLYAGKDEVKEGGIPNSARLGGKKFFYYMLTIVLLHSIIYFSFEALSLSYIQVVLMRIALSSAVAAGIIYFIQRLFFRS